jgi:hypothetical protein
MNIPAPRRADDGSVLLIVLLFVGVVGLLTVAITEQVRVSVGNTIIVRGQQALVAAADGGIRHAIQDVRQDSTACLDSSESSLPSPPTIDGKNISLTCASTSGVPSGVFGYAIVTTDSTADSLTTSGGGDKLITGPVFSARLDDGLARLTVGNGNVIEKQGPASCMDSGDKPSGLTVQPPGLFSYKCLNASVPTALDVLPTNLITTAGTANTTNPACTIYMPNRRYTGTINFGADTYFPSGTYYFENATINVGGGARVVGGASGGQTNSLGLTACANDGAVVGTTGSGVKWIFGGTTTLNTSSSGGSIELFARHGGTPAADGTDGITLTQVPLSASGWLPSTVTAPTNILDESSGSNPDLAIHGIVDVPRAGINLDNVSNSSRAQFQGGVVAGRFTVQNSGSSKGLAVSIETGDQPRILRLVSTASSGESGDKTITATAIVQLMNDSARTVTVLSWRSTQ